ncbi:hypothetical protein [Lysinibacillus sp. BF-4]|uniref:hypothetical protein n=1 Tax=Lysinibacillus sp. BF-4 TaxID=1473546 RepID=UPI000A92E124|nr:hypothetical protein [Lysinibacillus sp. BF-4]
MSFGAAEWLAVISVVVGVVVAIQSARFARSERQQDELERVYPYRLVANQMKEDKA